jgi:peptidoglycan hydrolase-like protein with peptidoglycan-binding domain
MTAGVGFALYLATAPDSVSAPAEADAVSIRPVMRAQSTASSASNVIRVALTSQTAPLEVSASAPARGSRIRQLQKALARAECYNGPINGIWSDASKDAMRGFVKSVNAELPVNAPDEALVALVESNDMAKCTLGRIIETGALEQSAPVAPQQDNSAPTLLGRAWAPAGMLVPAKDAASADRMAEPEAAAQPKSAEITASNDISPAASEPASQTSPAIHFEGGKPLPAAQQADPTPIASPRDAEPSPAAAEKPKKTKTAKRRPAKYDDIETSVSKSFDTLQRSISSMF